MAADHPSRLSKRLKIFEPFVLTCPKGTRRAHLLDVSETGAKVHCLPCGDTGVTIRLEIRGQSFDAKVAWSKSPKMGVSFARSLSADTVRALLQDKAL